MKSTNNNLVKFSSILYLSAVDSA